MSKCTTGVRKVGLRIAVAWPDGRYMSAVIRDTVSSQTDDDVLAMRQLLPL